MQSYPESLELPPPPPSSAASSSSSTYFVNDHRWDKILKCYCCTLIILLITVVLSLIFVEYYGVNKLCYKYIHPDMQTIGDFRNHNHQSIPIC